MKNYYAGIILLVLQSFAQASGAAEDSNQISRVKSVAIGPLKYEVTCFESADYCAEEFKKLCPDGFNVDGYFRDEYDHGQITAIIICKNSASN
ncbi:MAG: hypothetical protein ACKVHQ_00160 [Gammaproteobacteria bacterium]